MGSDPNYPICDPNDDHGARFSELDQDLICRIKEIKINFFQSNIAIGMCAETAGNSMNRHLISVVIALSAWINGPTLAMTLERVGNDLFATGPTVDQDYLSFKEAFKKEGIQRLILVNGPGGDLWTGMQIARMVQEAKIKTVVSGYCMSACSLIFMAVKTELLEQATCPG